MKRILVVDDDENIRQLVSLHLQTEGYLVGAAANGQEALDKLAEQEFDLAVVDVMMPLVDGYELTEDIRASFDLPVILLTAKSQIDDKEEGFSSGADDYLVKPFEPRELIFRIKALLRRYEKTSEDIIQLNKTSINSKSYEVTSNNQTILLPLKEFELLFFLASNLDQVFSREQIIDRIWGYDYEGDIRTVDVHIKRLRKQFPAESSGFTIRTVRGVGYSLEVN